MLRRSSLVLSSWRDQGISYVKYLNVSTEALHMALNEKSKSRFGKFSNPNYQAYRMDSTGMPEPSNKIPAFTKDY